jgi:transcriptional regulator with XRE-family HTH domain
MDTIGSRLKAYAKARCGSIKRLAEEIGVRPDNLQKYASGRNEPGSKLLLALARHGCNVHWLLTGDGQMLAEDLRKGGSAKQDQEILTVLKTAGIGEVERLKTLLEELRNILDAQQKLNELVPIRKTSERKRIPRKRGG